MGKPIPQLPPLDGMGPLGLKPPEKPEAGKVYSLTAIAEGKSLSEAEVTIANPQPSDAEKYASLHRAAEPQPPAFKTVTPFKATAFEPSSKKATPAKPKPNGVTHPLEVGDILDSSWGYDQTNVDFYEVIALNGKTFVTVEKVPTVDSGDESGGPSTDWVIPGEKDGGLTFKRKVQVYGEGAKGDAHISIESYSSASLWSGKPRSQTAWGWGH